MTRTPKNPAASALAPVEPPSAAQAPPGGPAPSDATQADGEGAGGSTPVAAGPDETRASGPPAATGLSGIAAAMSEDRGRDSLDAHVRRLLRDLGLSGYHTKDSRRSAKGYPDWTIAGPGGVIWRELKAQRGRVTPEQRAWLDILAAAGGDAGTWRPADLLSGRIAQELMALAGVRGAAWTA